MIPQPGQKLASEKLLMESDLAFVLAHELRNPITTLMNLAYLLEHHFEPKHVEMMKKQLLLCESIIGNLLEYSRTHRPSPQNVFLHDVAQQIGKMMMISPRIHLEILDQTHGACTSVDPVHFRQVLINLLQNALDAFEEGEGSVRIEITLEDGWIRLDVVDNGPGIPENVDIFAPHVTTKKHGIGIGLTLSKELIEANNGRITASRLPGSGSRFSIFLPLAE